ncbi:MAG: hypothetical protein WC875_06040, partial [Candidatus Absconditabacterales bacterium]
MEDSNTLSSSVLQEQPIRLRVGIANIGKAQKSAAAYKLQAGSKSGVSSCSDVAVWTGIDTNTSWEMVDSAFITHAEATTALLENTESYAFVEGDGLDTADTSGSIGPLPVHTVLEVEYALQATTSS